MELDGPPRMVGWITWSGRERSSQTQFLPVPGVWLIHLPLFNSEHLAIQKIFRILNIPQIIQIMSKTRMVRASSEILNNCSCLWEHSIDTRKASPPRCGKNERRTLRLERIGHQDDLGVSKLILKAQ